MSSVLFARNERHRLMGLLLRFRAVAYAVVGIPALFALSVAGTNRLLVALALTACAVAPFLARLGGRFSGVRLSATIDAAVSLFVWIAVPDAAAITLVLTIWTVAIVEFFSNRATANRFATAVMTLELAKIALVLLSPDSFPDDTGVMILLIAGRTAAIGLSFITMRGLDQYLLRLSMAAEESTDRYRRLMESAPTAFVVVTDGTVAYANSAASSLVGAKGRSLEGRKLLDLVHPESRAEVRERVARSEARLEPLSLHNIRLVSTEGGDDVIVDAAATPIDFASELAIQIALHDVSAQRRAESELRATRLNFRSFFERIPVALYRSRPDGEIIQANRALVELLGARSETDLIGLDASRFFVDPEDRAHLTNLLSEQRIVVGYETRLRRMDGEVIWIRDTSRLIETDIGEVYEGAMVDVTGRRNIEDELWSRAVQQEAAASIGQIALEAEDLGPVLRSVTETVARVLRSDGALVLDRSEQGVFELAGASANVDVDVRAVATLADRSHMTAAPVVLRTVEEVRFAAPALAAAGYASAIAVMIPGADIDFGTLIALSRTERLFTSEDLNFLHSVANVLAAAVDRASAKARLEELLASKDAFVASVSHELRTPLTVVNGMAIEMAEHWRSLSEAEMEEFTGMLVEQSQDMADLIEDLLIAARANVGTVAVRKEPVELARHIESVLAGYLAEPGKTITMSLHEGIVDADPIRVRQILRNLVTNAIRYGGPRIDVIMTSTSGAHIVEVVDDGPGIPVEDRERIFEAYERAHTAMGQPGSVGLGLTVSRTLADLMGGSLTYKYDGRSRFRLELSRDVDAERDARIESMSDLVESQSGASIGVARIGVDVGVVES